MNTALTVLVAILSCGELFSLARYLIERKDKQKANASEVEKTLLEGQKVIIRHSIIDAYDLAKRRGYTTTQGSLAFHELVQTYDNILDQLGEDNGFIDDTVIHYGLLEVRPTLDD